ncbi:MAG: hypothetical protein E3J37_06445 [Anaerolineales bacterium]|nr:MAG: hypothetical protein E3J37_06445 [Anaerolineales bacterium]
MLVKLNIAAEGIDMRLLGDLLATVPEGEVIQVRIGLHWTAVVTEVEGRQACGLSSTLESPHEHGGEPQVPQAGLLETLSGRELAELALEVDRPTLASIGVATINSLLPPPPPESWDEGNAEHVIAAHGAGKRVVIVGSFPFVPRLKSKVGELIVLDRHPREGDLPAEAAPQVVPDAEVIAITGMTLVNHTLEDLLKLCSPQALVILLGPSTPFSQVLFDYGVDMLCGSLVTDIEPVLSAVSQGANFRQVHHAGVRLVTVVRSGFGSRS